MNAAADFPANRKKGRGKGKQCTRVITFTFLAESNNGRVGGWWWIGSGGKSGEPVL